MGSSAAGVEDRSSEFLVCRTCGPTSRRVEEAQRESKRAQEMLERGKEFEKKDQVAAARQCLEQALGPAKAWLHRGNWVLSELHSLLASVCVQLQVRDAVMATMLGRRLLALLFFLLLTDSLVCSPLTNRAHLLAWNLI